MAKEIYLKRINTKLAELEKNPNRTQKEIDSIKEEFNLFSNLESYSEEELSDLAGRLNSLKVAPVNDKQRLSLISPKNLKFRKKTKILLTAAIVAAVLGASGCSLTSYFTKEDTALEDTVSGNAISGNTVSGNTVSENTVTPIEKQITEKVLPDDWAFDPNDNIEIINRMSNFIYNAVEKGIPVKDVMTEEEIALANKNDESLVTIEQLMDFYMVWNVEDIDPIDYARLQYYTKTKETIVDNYSYCARVFATDSLTATKDNVINYAGIINDKESSKAVQKFVNYLAEYNTTNNKKELGSEIFEYIKSTYINKDANIYSMASNEFVYRLMFDADFISNNSIIPKDMNVILNEDGKLTCGDKKEDGVKGKTERAEEYTSLSNAVEQKLEIAREFYNQDLTSISKDEQKTGIELEKEIKEKVISMDVEYHANEKFVISTNSPAAAKSTNASNKYTAVANGQNVSEEELAKYNAHNQAEYEAAKKAEFAKEAQNDPNHTIKDQSGDVVVNGAEADAQQYNSGYAAGYSDGNNKLFSNPGQATESYKAGYNVGYEKGLSIRIELDKSLPPLESTYEPVTNGSTTIVQESITEQPYTGDVNTSTDSNSLEGFEPIDGSAPAETTGGSAPAETTGSTDTQTIDYQSSINILEQMIKELLDLSNIYTNDSSKSKC